jgi:hypothetical protein
VSLDLLHTLSEKAVLTFTPFASLNPLPLMTPLLPLPTKDLFEPMLIGLVAALSYLTCTFGALDGHQLLALMAVWHPAPVPQGAQPVAVVVPSVPVKSKVLVKTIVKVSLEAR